MLAPYDFSYGAVKSGAEPAAKATAAASLCPSSTQHEHNPVLKIYTHTQGEDVSRAAAKAEHHR